jgi:hypothetical protein
MKLKILNNTRIKSRLFILLVVLNIALFSLFLIPHQVSAQDSSLPDASLSPIPESDHKTAEPGEVVNYKMVLKNRGEQRETFIISIESNYNWNVEVSPQTGISLSPGETEDIIITFHIPVSIQDTDYQFDLVVKSRGLPAAETTIHVIGYQDTVIITAALRPVLIIYPEKDHLGKISPRGDGGGGC